MVTIRNASGWPKSAVPEVLGLGLFATRFDGVRAPRAPVADGTSACTNRLVSQLRACKAPVDESKPV